MSGWGLGRLEDLERAFLFIANRLGDIWFYLDNLPGFFKGLFLGIKSTVYNLMDKCLDIRWDLYEFRLKYGNLIEAMLDRVSRGEVLSAVDLVWPDFYWFRVDPGGMIRWWLTQGVPGLDNLLSDPGGWLQEAFDWFTPGLSRFIRNPQGWLESWLMDTAPILYYVVRGEWGFVNEAIYQMHPWARYIFDDWREWLRFRVGDILGVEYRFWFDPVGYIKELVIEYRDEWVRHSVGWIQEIGEHVLSQILTGEW